MSSMMETFPEWSDDDSRELDDFLSQPWPDERIQTNDDGWPEFQPNAEWRHFSSNQGSKIVRITAVPSDEDDSRDDYHVKRTDWNEARDGVDADDDDDDESVLTLSSLAGATVELASSARPTTPTKTQSQQRALLRQKLPMLLCKSERLKQPSPGDRRVRFREEQDSEEENIPLDPIIEIGVDNSTEKFKMERPVVMKNAVKNKPPRIQQARSASRPTGPKTLKKDVAYPDSPLEAYSGQCSASNWIHNANLFEDKTLPSNTLDFFCRDSALAGGVPPAMKEVSYSEEDTVTCSSQSTSSGISSLPSGAADEKLAHVFSLSSVREGSGVCDPPAPRISPRDPPAPRVQEDYGDFRPRSRDNYETNSGPPTRKKDGYREEPSIDTTSSYNSSRSLFSHTPPSGSKVADRQKWLNAAFVRDKPSLDGRPGGASPVSNVSGTINKFGGRATRISAVQQKKEELERKLAETNKGKPTIKTKWEGRPGSYKKKVVLSSY